MDEDRLRELLESPLDDDGRRWPVWPWALVIVATVAAGLFLLGNDEPPSVATTAVEEEPGETSPQTTLLGQPGYPEVRAFHEQVHDPATGRIVVVGGAVLRQGGRLGAVVEDVTWAYDPATDSWFSYDVSPQPPGRTGHALALDGASGLIVMFGGAGPVSTCGVTGPCSVDPKRDTWVLDPSTGAWEQRNPPSSPSARYGAAMAYDAESEMLVLFGGSVRGAAFANQSFADTWTYDVAADRWTELAPASSPAARGWHRMVYDPRSDRILMFGGGASGGLDGLVWAYDANAGAWEAYSAIGPAARWTPAMAWDEQSRRLVVFGGQGPVVRSLGEAGTATDISLLGDMWLFDPRADAWQERPSPFDGLLFWVPATWDPGTDRTVMFAYRAIGLYDADTGEWVWREPPDGEEG